MRLADYVMQFLEKKEVSHIFMLSGGGIMYLVDALGHSSISHVCCHHEQAAGIAAQAYALKKNGLGVCLITTGPGGTNALTPCGAAYVDSTPILFISGQVKTSDFASIRNVRQYGAQENDIISMAKPITKYAVTIMNPNEIRYHLEKAIYKALNGRQGPVWLDIPLDVQNAEINPDELTGYEINKKDSYGLSDTKMMQIANLMGKAKRPLFLLGYGVKASKSQELFKRVNNKLNFPVVSTWRALDVIDNDDPLFFGSPGLQAPRYSNLILQGADLLIVLGSRLDNMITAFNEEHFAYRAKKIIVDIDSNEMAKLNMPELNSVCCDINVFLSEIYTYVSKIETRDRREWIDWCKGVKGKYPLLEEKQEINLEYVNLYRLTMAVSEKATDKDTIVVSSTSRCNTAGHIAFNHRQNQNTISSMGFGSMGFALPSVVGSHFANEDSRIIMFEGDGSLQLNIQELQTIIHYGINAKMFVFSNTGYAAIATMQDRNFDGFHVGSDPQSGVSMPCLQKISEAYGIQYYCIKSDDEIDNVVESVMQGSEPVICEVLGDIQFDEIPKCISSINDEGGRVSAALENPYPFLSNEEMNEIYLGI